MNCRIKKENIKLFASDFDGIFTDGKLTVYSDGTTSKKIDYKDIMAIANLLKANIHVAVISGETSKAIEVLKQKFPSIDIFQNIRNKLEVLQALVDKYNLTKENVVYTGDDINDIKCLEYASLAFTVENAHKNVKKMKNINIIRKNGGEGAVREIADLLI